MDDINIMINRLTAEQTMNIKSVGAQFEQQNAKNKGTKENPFPKTDSFFVCSYPHPVKDESDGFCSSTSLTPSTPPMTLSASIMGLPTIP